jgi:hypothetical protein
LITFLNCLASRQPRPVVGFLSVTIFSVVLIVPQIILANNLLIVLPPELQPWVRLFTNISTWILLPICIAAWLGFSVSLDATAVILGASEGNPKLAMESIGYGLIPAILLSLASGVLLLFTVGRVTIQGTGEEAINAFVQNSLVHPEVQLAMALSRTGLQLSGITLAFVVAKAYRLSFHAAVAAVMIPVGLWWLLTTLVNRVGVG